MKRLIPILLALLLLCGCAAEPEPTETQTPTTEYVEPTEPAGSYEPGSEEEIATGGALRTYPVEEEAAYAITMVGNDVLLFSGLDRTVLTLMTGENLYTIAQTTLDITVHPDDPSFRITENGITYYDDQDGSLVFLDQDLNEVSRKHTPEAMTGSPILSGNRMKLYYCTADAIRVLDLETGIDRLLKEISYPEQWVGGILLDDTVLCCCVRDENGENALFLSTETGELLYQRENDLTVSTCDGSYYVNIPEGIMRLSLFGRVGEEPWMLSPRDPFAPNWYLENINAAVTASETDESLTLDYYDLETGLRSASLSLTEVYAPESIEADASTGYVYLLAEQTDETGHRIYRWDTAKSPSGDMSIYTGERYTLQNPDANGLALCDDRAFELSQIYGVEVLVGMDAVAIEPWDYELYPEYQVPVVNQMLDQLEQVLQTYPDGFFRTLTEKTTNVPVKICLVRSMYGSPESGSLDTANGIQFWDGSDAYVAIGAGELFSQTFYHEMFHVIETCVYSHSNAYDDWNKLNPKGFEYDYDYLTNLDRVEEDYLQEETRCFVDTYSMSYPKEDRARIMEYASVEGNESLFVSKTMQKKLEALCVGIREAFDLREYPNAMIWEQYLKEPLTP